MIRLLNWSHFDSYRALNDANLIVSSVKNFVSLVFKGNGVYCIF
jgi:hypothetical protein